MKTIRTVGIFGLLIIFLMLISCANEGQTLIFKVENVTYSSNLSNVSVPLYLDNDILVDGFQFEVNHTPYLRLTGVQTTSRMINSTIEYLDANGTISMAVLTQSSIQLGNGSIMNLTFDISANATAGNYTLNITNAFLTDSMAQIYSATDIQGIFTILN